MSLVNLLSSMARTRRVPRNGWKVLTGKQKSDFNKGKRSMKTGFLDNLANFRVVPTMLPQYIVPELIGDTLRPNVAHKPPRDEDEQP